MATSLGGRATAAAAATYEPVDGAALAGAVQSADAQPGPSTIRLRAAVYAPSQTLVIRRDVTIVGPDAPGGKIVGTAVTPAGASLFEVSAAAHARFVNVALTGAGYQGSGSAIDDFGSAELTGLAVAGNGGQGLTVEPGASATATNVTFSDGLADGVVDSGTATLSNVTVAANAQQGIDSRGGTLRLLDTIVAKNAAGDCSVPATVSDHSLDGDGSCGVGALSGRAPLLGPLLASNGGPTPTRALLAGSPAIGAGAACPAVDQRGYARGADRCDLGAYQYGASAPAGGPPPTGASGASSSVVGLAGHGILGRTRIAFSLAVRTASPHGSFSYRDARRRLWLRATRITSVSISVTRGTVTLTGIATDVLGRRRVRFSATATCAARTRALRVRVGSRYRGGGRLVRGALSWLTAPAG